MSEDFDMPKNKRERRQTPDVGVPNYDNTDKDDLPKGQRPREEKFHMGSAGGMDALEEYRRDLQEDEAALSESNFEESPDQVLEEGQSAESPDSQDEKEEAVVSEVDESVSDVVEARALAEQEDIERSREGVDQENKMRDQVSEEKVISESPDEGGEVTNFEDEIAETFQDKSSIEDKKEADAPELSVDEQGLESTVDDLKETNDSEVESRFNPGIVRAEIEKVEERVQSGELDEATAREFIFDLKKQDRLDRMTHIQNEMTELVSSGEDWSIEEYDQLEEQFSNIESLVKKAEYFKSRRDSKEATEAYYDAISEDFSERNVAYRVFGYGRDKLGPRGQEAYEKYKEASNEHNKFAKESGMYDRLAEVVNKKRDGLEDKFSIDAFVAERYLFAPAEKQLELQTSQLSERGKNILSVVKGLALGSAVGAVIMTPVAAISIGAAIGTGIATRYLGNKGLDRTIGRKLNELKGDTINGILENDELDFEAAERIFAAEESLQFSKTTTKSVSIAAAIGVGGATAANIDVGGWGDLFGDDNNVASIETPSESVDTSETIDPDSPDGPNEDVLVEPEPPIPPKEVPEGVPDEAGLETLVVTDQSAEEVLPTEQNSLEEEISIAPEEAAEVALDDVDTEIPVAPEKTIEIDVFHEVSSKWDTTSDILFEGFKDRLDAGEIELPAGVERDGLVAHMYQTFPEMTDASDVSAKLTPEQWKDVGVSSGDPQKIILGKDVINVQALTEIMSGGSPDEVIANLPDSSSASVSISEAIPTVDPDAEYIFDPDQFAGRTAEDTPMFAGDIDPNKPITSDDFHGNKDDLEIYSDPTPQELAGEAIAAKTEALTGTKSDLIFEISWDYAELTESLENVENLHEHLTEVLERGVYEDQEITLPSNLVFGENNFADNLAGLVEFRLPEFSTELVDKPDPALSPEIWKALGIDSGSPFDIAPTDELQTGKLLNFFMNGDVEALRISLGLEK